MPQPPATHLDAGAFEQALAVLDRAQPSAREDWLFRLLNLAVWGAVTLTAFYLVMHLLPGFEHGSEALWLARAIAVLFVAIVPVFVVNWRLVKKLRTAARQRRRLAPSFRRRLMNRFKARRRQHRLINLATLVLSLVGYVVAVVALLGLIVELLPDPAPLNTGRVTLYSVAVVFGLSCVFLHFMARGRERLQVIAELRSSLLASRSSANDSQLSPEDYDEITRIERGQIAADRRRSVKAAARESLEYAYGLREHRAFREAKLQLSPETLMRVQACIDQLTSGPGAVAGIGRADDATAYIHVPETSLQIGFTVDRDAREIRLLSLSALTMDGTSSISSGSEG
jgi:hypothetical protein